MTDDRKQQAYRVREEAAALARSRPLVTHQANGDEQKYSSARYCMSFTKGLAHDPKTGLLADAADFESFREAIDNGFVEPFTANVPGVMDRERPWEAPTAGVVFDLEGPDAQAVTMPPAPPLGSDELTYEMAEVYWLAALRDVDLADFAAGSSNATYTAAIKALNGMAYKPDGDAGRPRVGSTPGTIDAQTAFRGSSPGVEVGPYLSQFMIIGNVDQTGQSKVGDGLITYGALQIDQRVPVAVEQDFMCEFDEWLCVQEGKNARDNEGLFGKKPKPRRFITTPRDLATYVHDDALYQAYLNACLILLSMRTPFDPAFDALSGGGDFIRNDCCSEPVEVGCKHRKGRGPNGVCRLPRKAGGFALWGGPHVLTLVCEVATRALKAVRFQKFNNHIRLRPEALAARLEKAKQIEAGFPVVGSAFSDMAKAVKAATDATSAKVGKKTKLLPMAFQEGSPMHPAYGAGHATVAGACVTILKAWFDTGAVFVRRTDEDGTRDLFAHYDPDKDKPVQYGVNPGGGSLNCVTGNLPLLTLEGELNKLAANISIGRNMAGVHYYSDYYDSVRMGEEIAIGMLEEQALGYTTDRFVLSVPTFDGEVVRIGRR